MNKKIIGILAILVAVIATINVSYIYNSQTNLSIVSLSIEALSSCETLVRNERGSQSPLRCKNALGQEYILSACDFSSGYMTTCNGRSTTE